MTRNATPDERADHDRDLRKHELTVSDLVKSLASYVSLDDVELDRKTFLRYVSDRIASDLASETARNSK
jgi:hypothetical protein